MATQWISPTWRMPENSNQSKVDNYSLSFDGTNDFIDVVDVNLGVNSSIILWFNPSSIGPGDYVLLGEGANGFDYTVRRQSGAFYVWVSSTFYNFGSTITSNIVNDEWNFLAIVKNAGTIDVNLISSSGAVVATQTESGWASANMTFDRIGARTITPVNLPFEGKIGQVAGFDSILTSDQITALYNSGTPVNPMALTPLPTYYYPLGGGSTGDAADPATTLTVPNESVPSATVFNFRGSPIDYITMGNTLTKDGSTAFSISCWIKYTGSGTEMIVSKQDASGIGYLLHTGNFAGVKLCWYPCIASGGNIQVRTSNAYNDGNWHNVLATYDGSGNASGAKIYVDGTLDTNIITDTFTGTSSSTGPFQISARNGTSFPFVGDVSNVVVWSSDQNANKDNIYNNGVPQSTYTTNPEAWYKLNVDTSTWENVAQQWRFKNNQITPINYDRAGQSNLAYGGAYFNYVTTTNLTQSRTISLWIKYDINRQTGTLRVGFFNDPSLTFYTTGFREINQASSGVVTFTVPGINVSDGGWHHILLHTIGDSADASNIAYIDGQLATRSVIGTNSYTFGNPGVGYGKKGGTLPPAAYSFSNLVMYNGDATSNVDALYNNGTPPADVSSTTPDVWWKTNSTNSSVTTLEDFSGNNNDSTTTYTQPVNMVTDNLIAESGISSGMTTANLVNSDLTRSIPYSSYSMVLDGTDDYIDCGPGFQYTNVTVSCWVNFNTLGSFDRLLQTGITGGGIGVLLTLDNSAGGNKITAGWTDAATDDTVISTSDVVVDTWYNVTFTRNASGIKIYINGIDVSGGTSPGFSYGASNNLELGRRPGGSNNLDGNLSNVAIFNSVLSEDQIITIYNGGAPNDISGLAPASWWSLSGDSYFNGNDWICPDLGSNGSDGTSDNMGGTELVGDGPGSTANGIATSMNIPGNLQGNAPNSTSNAFSINMVQPDRETDVPPTP